VTQSDRITLRVEGRTFVQEPPTFEQEMYIMEAVVESGIDKVPSLELAGSADAPDLEIVAKQMLLTAYRSGALFKLLGALVVEDGQEWSVDLAERQAELFRKTRDQESKKQLQPAMIGAVLAFFESGGGSGMTSPISSDLVAVTANSPPDDSTPLLTPEQAEAVFRTGSMKSLSSRSPSTTASTPSRSSGSGRSVTGSSPAKPSAGRRPAKSTRKPA